MHPVKACFLTSRPFFLNLTAIFACQKERADQSANMEREKILLARRVLSGTGTNNMANFINNGVEVGPNFS